jgi:hypothetical protein
VDLVERIEQAGGHARRISWLMLAFSAAHGFGGIIDGSEAMFDRAAMFMCAWGITSSLAILPAALRVRQEG